MTKQPKPIAVSEVIERLARAGDAYTQANGVAPLTDPALGITASGEIIASIWGRTLLSDLRCHGSTVPEALEKLEAAVAALDKGALE